MKKKFIVTFTVQVERVVEIEAATPYEARMKIRQGQGTVTEESDDSHSVDIIDVTEDEE